MSLPDSEPDTPLHESEYKPPSTGRTRTHPRYSFLDDRLSLTVGDIQYTIHEHLLATHAPIWLDELNQTAKPIVLHDVRTSEMDSLLSILYPSDVCGWDISNVEDWRSVLRLASRWHFQSVRKLAIKHLEDTASTSEKVVLAREFDISAWLLPSLVSLCVRPDPLKLFEAENMSMADVVLVFTTHELVKTGQLRADTNTVSRHIQQLLDPQPASDVPEGAVRQEDRSTVQGNPEPLVGLTSVTPIATTYEPEVLAQALNEKDYDKAVTAMTGGDFEDTIRRMNAWFPGSPTNQAIASIQDLVWAIVRGSACNGDFIPSAVRILSEWRQGNSRRSNTIDGVLREATYQGILSAPSEQISYSPSSSSWRAIYAPYERWLSDSEYALRCRNARKLVAELARSGVLDLTAICDNLPIGAEQARALYEDLLVLGPLLDVPGVKERLDRQLSNCDNAVWYGTAAPDHQIQRRLWMQKIFLLRKRGWVPEDTQ